MARIKVFDKKTQSWVYADESFSSIPIKGVDYYTEEEKVEFKNFIRDELTKRGQLKPEFANTVADCKDQSKLYVLPDGFIYAYMYDNVHTNRVSTSTDTDGSVYNGVGYMNGYAIDRSEGTGEAVVHNISTLSGFIAVNPGDVIRVYGVDWHNPTGARNCLAAYTSDFTYIGSCYGNFKHTNIGIVSETETLNEHDAKFTLKSNNLEIAYIRVSSCGLGVAQDGTNMIVTVNEDEVSYSWRNTGHAFVPADYEDRIIALEQLQGGHSGVAAEITSFATASELSTLYEKGVRIVVENPKDNLIPSAISQNGVVFNGCGYRKEYRLTNTGGVTSLDDAVLTGYIPYIHGKTIQIIGGLHQGDDYGNYMAAYNSAFEPILVKNVRKWARESGGQETVDENNIKSFTVNTNNIPDIANAAYIRISLRPCVGRNMQVRYI